jgi:hypothetical protein
MVAADGTCLHRGASLMDADANMNCTKRRPEEATSEADVPGTITATSIPSINVETEMQVTDKINYVPKWRWPDLAVQLFIHLGCLYGFYLIFTSVKMLTTLWGKSAILYSLHFQTLSLCHTKERFIFKANFIGGWRKVHSQELHKLYCSPKIIRPAK